MQAGALSNSFHASIMEYLFLLCATFSVMTNPPPFQNVNKLVFVYLLCSARREHAGHVNSAGKDGRLRLFYISHRSH